MTARVAWSVDRCGWRDLAAAHDAPTGRVHLITDAPYSDRTHDGHAAGTAGADDAADRRDLSYASWHPDEVRAFVGRWSPLVDGWFVSITDDVLFPVWRDALKAAGRTVFADVPCVIRGMTVRLRGDGPSSWAVHAVVARPPGLVKWRTLPGAYVGPRERPVIPGGKPLWLMEQIVNDYTDPGDTVIDPCCGAGSTLVAAVRAGRVAIGGDANPVHVDLATSWLRDGRRPAPIGAAADEPDDEPAPQGAFAW